MNELMRREMESQPEYLKNCLPELRSAISKINWKGKRIIAGGCGDSYYSAFAVYGLYDSLNVPYISATALEIEQRIALEPEDIVVLTSISGSTKRTLQAAQKAREHGALTVAVTCKPGSTLAGICEHTIVLPYEPISRKTPHSLDYTVNLLANVIIAEQATGVEINSANHIASFVEQILSPAFDVTSNFADNLTSDTRQYFLGANSQFGSAMYASAKFHETGGLIAFHSETENFWHGFNFMVRPEDTIILFHNPKESTETEQILVDHLNQLTNNVLYIGPKTISSPFHIITPSNELSVMPFFESVSAQALCYNIATNLQIQVDDPSSKFGSDSHHESTQSSWFAR